jgi:hypothetical protein
VFGIEQDTAVAVQKTIQPGYGVDERECFSQPPDLAAGLPRLALRTISLMIVDLCTSDVMQANMSLLSSNQ